MRSLRALVVSKGRGTRAHVGSVLPGTGSTVVRESDDAFDALRECFEGGTDVAVVEDSLPRLNGSAMAGILEEFRAPVTVVLLHSGEHASVDGRLALDPSREGFEVILTNVFTALAESPRGVVPC